MSCSTTSSGWPWSMPTGSTGSPASMPTTVSGFTFSSRSSFRLCM